MPNISMPIVATLGLMAVQTDHPRGSDQQRADDFLGSFDAFAQAVRRARAYVQAAIQTAPGFGGGHGPLGHGLTCDPTRFDEV